MMRRREFIGLIAGAAALPLAARAQRAEKVWRIGMLDTTPRELNRVNMNALLGRLRELGYVEGQNLTIDYRASDGDNEHIRDFVSELIGSKVDLMIVRGTQEAQAIKEATSTLPVVMCGVADPVGAGVALSLARPGLNFTGLSSFITEVETKRIALLKEIVPGMKKVALVGDFRNRATQNQWNEVKIAAETLAINAVPFDVRSATDLKDAFERAIIENVEAFRVAVDATTRPHRKLIIELAETHKIPVIYVAREFVDSGGLVSYAPDYATIYSRGATYVDKIFKGALPAELPIELPTKFELVLNLGTAKALGLSITPMVFSLTDVFID
jgi:putative ABC transport system substrate-binding protein